MGRDNPWGNWEEWFGTNSIVARAEVYKNYIYLYMLVENRTEETNKLKDILDNKKIPNQITIWMPSNDWPMWWMLVVLIF